VTAVSSVAAFLARARPGVDAGAAQLLAALDLDDEARAVLAAQAEPADQRRGWLERHTGHAWSAARLAHVEARAFVAIRRQLQERGALAG
jgi:hypothetical protein